MSEPDSTPSSSPSSAEERQKRIEEKTSVKEYTLKQVKQEGVIIIGGALGWLAAKGLLKNAKFAKWAEGKVVSLGESLQEIEAGLNALNQKGDSTKSESFAKSVGKLSHIMFSAFGALIGMTVGGIINTYEHWRNMESEKLAVAEVNQDVANLVTERAHFADTLNRQENLIKELVAQGQNKGTSFTERSAVSAATAETTRS